MSWTAKRDKRSRESSKQKRIQSNRTVDQTHKTTNTPRLDHLLRDMVHFPWLFKELYYITSIQCKIKGAWLHYPPAVSTR